MQPLAAPETGVLPGSMTEQNEPDPGWNEATSASGPDSRVRVALQRIGSNRWCVVDPRYPANDARCLIGYVERVDHVYHAIRLDAAEMVSFDETDLESVLRDLEPTEPPNS